MATLLIRLRSAGGNHDPTSIDYESFSSFLGRSGKSRICAGWGRQHKGARPQSGVTNKNRVHPQYENRRGVLEVRTTAILYSRESAVRAVRLPIFYDKSLHYRQRQPCASSVQWILRRQRREQTPV